MDTLGRRILLATDFSDASAVAADKALQLAVARAAHLVVLSVIEDAAARRADLGGLGGLGGLGPRLDQVRQRREAAARALVDQARARGVHATYLIWTGAPAECILEAAASESAETIVVGSHRRGPVGRFLFGSVSGEVVRRAQCPVVVAAARRPASLRV